MKQVVVEQFGGPEVLKLVETPAPVPGPGQVRVRLTSIGMNHADLAGRRGEYKLATGEPPFTPGLEGGGVIDAIGAGVHDRAVGQRVILGIEAPRPSAGGCGGTYRSHYICPSRSAILAPASIPDEQLGALWLTYLTAWGCLIWKHGLKPGQFVAIPAASSGVGLAAAQVVKHHGGIPIGMTSSPGKVGALRQMPECAFDHLVLTTEPGGHPASWSKDLKRITGDHGVDVFFDPIAAGGFLEMEIRSLAPHGTVYLYGRLGKAGTVDLGPLMRKRGTIRGWVNDELVDAAPEVRERGYREILRGFESGVYRQHVDRVFRLDQVQEAHRHMETGGHIGKLVLVP